MANPCPKNSRRQPNEIEGHNALRMQPQTNTTMLNPGNPRHAWSTRKKLTQTMRTKHNAIKQPGRQPNNSECDVVVDAKTQTCTVKQQYADGTY